MGWISCKIELAFDWVLGLHMLVLANMIGNLRYKKGVAENIVFLLVLAIAQYLTLLN